MTDWTITATTIYCDAIGEEATLLVYRDGTSKCTGHDRHGNHQGRPARHSECQGPQCSRLLNYRDKLFAEEKTGSDTSSDG